MAVTASITISLDGYVAGPNDGPDKGLGEGGERLHYWVFGGPWSYESGTGGEPAGADKEFLETMMPRNGAVIGGRGTYRAADAWGGTNPWPVPFFILTHRPEEEPAGAGFTFVAGLDEALDRARAAAAEKDVHLMGGADVIRQALAAGVVEEIWVTISPLILGKGKRLFDGFEQDIELEPIGVVSSPLATHLGYRVKGRTA